MKSPTYFPVGQALGTWLPEDILVQRAQEGDGDAFARLVHQHFGRLVGVARRVVGDCADAEDVVQVALWKAYLHLAGYQHRSSISTWLIRITRNEGIGLLRKRRSDPVDHAFREPSTEDAPFCWLAARSRDPEQLLVSKEILRVARECLEALPEIYRRVLWLAAYEEMDNRQIAERLSLSLGTVKIRLFRARTAMSEALQMRLRCIPLAVEIKKPREETLQS